MKKYYLLYELLGGFFGGNLCLKEFENKEDLEKEINDTEMRKSIVKIISGEEIRIKV